MSEVPEIKTKTYQLKAKIIENKEIKLHYFKMTLKAGQIAKGAQPGQFLHIRVADTYNPLLRRPFSIHKIRSQVSKTKDQIEILYKVKGIGTEALSERQPGEGLDILGPLGNGFDLSAIGSQNSAILVAGGMGVAPLLFLAEKLTSYCPLPAERITAIIGARTKREVLCEKDFKNLGVKVKVCTDDGTYGQKALATNLLSKLLAADNKLSTRSTSSGLMLSRAEASTIYACGPKDMLKRITEISRKFKITSFASLEENMACGIGGCLGCVISTKQGFKRVCKDGPVFDLRKIIWRGN